MIRERQQIDAPVSVQLFEPLLKKYQKRFYVHLITNLDSAGARLQRYYFSFLFDFRGMSRSGLDVIASFNLGVPLSTFDRYRKSDVKKSQEFVE